MEQNQFQERVRKWLLNVGQVPTAKWSIAEKPENNSATICVRVLESITIGPQTREWSLCGSMISENSEESIRVAVLAMNDRMNEILGNNLTSLLSD